MGEWRAGARGAAAVVLGLLLVACSSGDGDSETDGAAPPDEESQQAVSDESEAGQDVPLVVDGIRDDQQRWEPAVTELQFGLSVLFAFERPGIDAECVAEATLEAQIATDGAPVMAWVSLEDGLVDMAPGASLGNGVIAQGSPFSRPEVDGDVMRWDVTELVTWSLANQATNPSLVLTLKPGQGNGGLSSGPPAAFGASEGGDAAVLRIADVPGCGRS